MSWSWWVPLAISGTRSFMLDKVTGDTLGEVLKNHVAPDATLHTDEGRAYIPLGRTYGAHHTVDHSEGEYVRDGVTTNHAEGYFSQLKRSIDGTHHHVSEHHLPR